MSSQEELLAEAYKRGILPPDMKSAYEEAQKRGVLRGGFVDDVVRSVAQGASMGFSDEIAAAGDATLGSMMGRGSQADSWAKRYEENLAAERSKDKAIKKEMPVVSAGSEIAGGVMGGVALGGLPGIGKVLAPSAGTSMIGNMGKLGLAGAAGGGVAGFGAGEGGFAPRMETAAGGAALGGAVGALTPPVVNAVGKGAGWIADKTGLRNTPRAAMRQTLRAIGRDQEAGGPGLDDIKRAVDTNVGPNYRPEMLGDVGGENVTRLAATASRTPGPSQQAAANAIKTRVEGQVGRISDDVARLVSPNTDYAGTVEKLITQRSQDAAPAYQAAFEKAAPVNVTPILSEIDEALKTAKGGIRTALQNARGLFLNADGQVDTTLAGLHQTKLAIDDLIQSRGETSLGRTAKRQIVEIQQKLLGAMDDASKVDGTSLYAEARNLYAGPSRAMEALDMGRRVLREDADVTAREIADMSQSEKEFFLAGVARAIRDKTGEIGDNRNAVASIWGKPALREKLQAAFPDDASFRQFSGLMQREMNMMERGNMMNPRVGSQTMPNMAGERDMNIDPSFLSDLRQGRLGTGTVGSVARFFLNPPSEGMNSATSRELAKLLYQTDQGANATTVQRLLEEAQRSGLVSDRTRRELAARLLLGTGAAVGGQTN